MPCLCYLSLPGAHWWPLLAWRAVAGPHLLPRPAAALPAPQGEQGPGRGRTVRGPKLGLGPPAPGWASQAALCLQVLSWFRPCRTPGFSRVAQEEGLWRKGCRPWGVGWGAVRPALPPHLSLWSQVASEPSGGAVPAWLSTMCPCGTGCRACAELRKLAASVASAPRCLGLGFSSVHCFH